MKLYPPYVGWLIILSFAGSILLAAASAVITVEARIQRSKAVRAIARADSLVTDWVGRGCAPRTKALP